MTDTAKFEYEEFLQQGTADVVVGFLSDPSSVGQISVLMDATIKFIEEFTTDITAKQPPPQPLACAEGCSFCCHGYEVHVSPLEVLSIAEHIAQSLDAEAARALVMHILETQEAKEQHSVDEVPRTNFACPLLKDGACQVYAVRPFTCRGFNSYDAKDCETRKVEQDTSTVIEGYIHPRRISQSVHNGFQQALESLKVHGDVLDLTPALLIAFTNPNVRELWLAGEDVFDQAKAQLFED